MLATKSKILGASWPQSFFSKVEPCLETAGGQPWTMRHQRQATLKKRLKSSSKTEGDSWQFPWTYVSQGVKGNKPICKQEFPQVQGVHYGPGTGQIDRL